MREKIIEKKRKENRNVKNSKILNLKKRKTHIQKRNFP